MDTQDRWVADPVDVLDDAHAFVAAGQRRMFRAIAQCDRAEVWLFYGCVDMAQWLSGRLGISNWAVARWSSRPALSRFLPGTWRSFALSRTAFEAPGLVLLQRQ